MTRQKHKQVRILHSPHCKLLATHNDKTLIAHIITTYSTSITWLIKSKEKPQLMRSENVETKKRQISKTYNTKCRQRMVNRTLPQLCGHVFKFMLLV